MKKLLLIVPLLMAACGPTYHAQLEQKLADKSEQERRAILAQECGQEIQKGLRPDSQANVRHFGKMKQICEEMTGQKVNVALPPSGKP